MKKLALLPMASIVIGENPGTWSMISVERGVNMGIFISVDQRSDGAVQVSISDENGGYRIAGAKYDGTGKTLLKRELTASDANEIKRYLRAIT